MISVIFGWVTPFAAACIEIEINFFFILPTYVFTWLYDKYVFRGYKKELLSSIGQAFMLTKFPPKNKIK